MLQDLSSIGKVVRNAVVFNPHNWERLSMGSDSLLQAVRQLFALLDGRGVEYVLVGGVALLNYVEGRNTQDIDLIMALSDVAQIPEIEIEHQENPYFARGKFEALQVDLLLTENPLFRLVQEKYSAKQSFLEQEITLGTVEGLLLLKLYALPSLYRQGDFVRVSIYENDIASLLYRYEPDMGAVISTLANYVGEGDLASIKDIVGEIKTRIKRFKESRDRQNSG